MTVPQQTAPKWLSDRWARLRKGRDVALLQYAKPEKRWGLLTRQVKASSTEECSVLVCLACSMDSPWGYAEARMWDIAGALAHKCPYEDHFRIVTERWIPTNPERLIAKRLSLLRKKHQIKTTARNKDKCDRPIAAAPEPEPKPEPKPEPDSYMDQMLVAELITSLPGQYHASRAELAALKGKLTAQQAQLATQPSRADVAALKDKISAQQAQLGPLQDQVVILKGENVRLRKEGEANAARVDKAWAARLSDQASKIYDDWRKRK